MHQLQNELITNVYKLVSVLPSTFTIKNIGGGKLLFNTVNTDDDTAIPLEKGQLVQHARVDTYARHTGPAGEDWNIFADQSTDLILFLIVDGVEAELNGEPVELVG